MAIEGQEHNSQVRDAMRRAQEDGAKKQQGSQPQGQQPQREEQRSRRDEGRASGRYASLADIGRLNSTPIPMTNTAAALEQFRRDFVEAMPTKEDNNMLDCQVFPIDASVAGIPFSLLIVAGFKRGAEDLGVGHHTFLIAGSADVLRPREESYRQQRVTIVQVPGEGYDARTREVVREVLQRHYVGKKLYSADAEVIQAGFPSAKDNPDAIADCVKNAFTAIKTAIDRYDPDAPRLNLRSDESANTYNTIHVQHRQNHVFDRGNQPTRADIIIDLVSRENRGRNSRDAIEQMVTGTRIARVGGFFDFVYAPAQGAYGRNDLYGRDSRQSNAEAYQLYALRFITTLIDTIDFSPTTQLLAMAITSAIGDATEVTRAFEPNLLLGEDDTRNIGALAIEPNLQGLDRGFGERVETKVASFTPGKRQALLRTLVQPGVIQSIDVPECGASTWQYIDLMAIADGKQAAMDRFYDAACVLTGGIFEDFQSRSAPIIDPHVERILGGIYSESQGGQRLDGRDFDYLALLNMLRPETEEDLLVVQKWGMAASSQDDTLLSQSDRYEIIRDFVPTFQPTQYFSRYNFNSGFVKNLVDAIAECKLSLNPTSSGRDGADRIRTTYGNIDQILNRPGSNGLYRNQRTSRDDRYSDRYSDRGSDRHDGRW